MKLVIFGANGPTGRLLTQQALRQGYTVTAYTRHPHTFPIRHERLQVLSGDVLDFSAVEQAVAGQDAVLSTLGVPFSRKPITLYSASIAHILQAMQIHGVRRLVCVTSSVTESEHDTGGGFLFEKILKPLVINVLGRTLYEDMRRMERLVMNSHVDWTIIRPSGLFETPTVTPYQVAEGRILGRFTSRADLADCMLQQLSTDQYVHKAITVATVSAQPRSVDFFLKEAVGQKTPYKEVT